MVSLTGFFHPRHTPKICQDLFSRNKKKEGGRSFREAEDTWQADKVNGDLLFF